MTWTPSPPFAIGGNITATTSTTNADAGRINFANSPNFSSGTTTTQSYTTQLMHAAYAGVSFNNTPAVTAGSAPLGASVGLKEDVPTTPSAPSGTNVQQGTANVSRTDQLTHG